MFDLDHAVLQWRRDFARERVFTGTDLDELEDHLRAAYDVELELNPSLPPARAFTYAVENLGTRGDLSCEFAKVSGKGWRRLLNAGRLLYVGAFFLPVEKYGVTLAHTSLDQGVLPGIQAFLVALLGGNVVGVLSALTNLLMAMAFLRQTRTGRKRAMKLSLALLGAGVLNLSWLVTPGLVSDLYAGYYAWLASFGVTGAALLLHARELPVEGQRKAAVLDG
jgi:hypothetical protein